MPDRSRDIRNLMRLALTSLVLWQYLVAGFAQTAETIFPLDGPWLFAPDPLQVGRGPSPYFHPDADRSAWRTVQVPHTWQVERGYEYFLGPSWYARPVTGHLVQPGRRLLLEFDAVNRDTQVWVNGAPVGEHTGSGYTAFRFDITREWKPDGTNWIVAEVHNRLSTNALPYRASFDWAIDGGIIRSVRLRALPLLHLDAIQVHAQLSDDLQTAEVRATVSCRLGSPAPTNLQVQVHSILVDPHGRSVASQIVDLSRNQQTNSEIRLAIPVTQPVVWHFDRPHLYQLRCTLVTNQSAAHSRVATFGIRSLQVKPGRFVLNGEPMRLMGVEWMPGADPRYGMAENARLTRQVLEDLKHLNTVITRFHWQQDASVFDFCDREGLLVQEEVPAWGRHPLTGPHLEAVQSRHLHEMILSHYNHPSIFAWGLANEIVSLTEEGHAFIRRGRDIARRLDPHRLLAMASNVMHEDPARDAGGLLDLLEWNDYSSTWFRGRVEDAQTHLDAIQKAWPDRPILVSEYGLCECHPRNPTGDDQRIALLRAHTSIYRRHPAVVGAVYFNYNDYRTPIGDKGDGAFQQRVHGVVDLFRHRKPSFNALRAEMSPVKELVILTAGDAPPTSQASLRITTRALEDDFPAYTLRDYELFWTAFDEQNLPVQSGRRKLADLPPGSIAEEEIRWPAARPVRRLHAEIFRPTGYSVLSTELQFKDTSP